MGTRREKDEVKLHYGGIAHPAGFFGFIFVGNRQPLVTMSKGEMQLAEASILIPSQNPSSLLGGRENKGSERRGSLPGGSQEIVSGSETTSPQCFLSFLETGLWQLLVGPLSSPCSASSLPTSCAPGLLPPLHHELCTVVPGSQPSPSLEQPVGFCCN